MMGRMLKNDLTRNKIITATLFLFIMMAALLVTHDAKVAAKTERVVYMLDGCIMDQLHLGKYEGPAQ